MLKKLTDERSRKEKLNSIEMCEVTGGGSVLGIYTCISNMSMWFNDCLAYGEVELQENFDNERNSY